MAEDEGSGVKDLTVTSFGLIIAYLLPGLIGLYGLSFWSATFHRLFATFLTSESNLGLFFIVVLASLAIGLFANGIRWLIFEQLFFTRHRTKGSFHQALSGERKLAAYRLVIDETYRYHQWWGGALVVIPISYMGWILGSWHTATLHQKVWISFLFVVIEIIAFIAAWQLWAYTVVKLSYVLGETGDLTSPGPVGAAIIMPPQGSPATGLGQGTAATITPEGINMPAKGIVTMGGTPMQPQNQPVQPPTDPTDPNDVGR